MPHAALRWPSTRFVATPGYSAEIAVPLTIEGCAEVEKRHATGLPSSPLSRQTGSASHTIPSGLGRFSNLPSGMRLLRLIGTFDRPIPAQTVTLRARSFAATSAPTTAASSSRR